MSYFALYMLCAYICFQATSATLIVNTAVIMTAGTAVVSLVAVAAANILTRLRGFRVKTAIFGVSFFSQSQKGTWKQRKKQPNIKICPESLAATLEY